MKNHFPSRGKGFIINKFLLYVIDIAAFQIDEQAIGLGATDKAIGPAPRSSSTSGMDALRGNGSSRGHVDASDDAHFGVL